MPLVRVAAEAGGRVMSRVWLFAAGAVVVIAAALVAGAVGTFDGGNRRTATAPMAATVDGPLRMASCREWNRATGPQRLGTVRQLAQLSGGPVAGFTNARGPRLDDQQAYDMFERSCAPSYARAFKLYKLYGRSAAFVGN